MIQMLIQSFPQNYRFKQLALPYVLISLKLHANTVMKLNVINLTFKLTDSYIYKLVQGIFGGEGEDNSLQIKRVLREFVNSI